MTAADPLEARIEEHRLFPRAREPAQTLLPVDRLQTGRLAEFGEDQESAQSVWRSRSRLAARNFAAARPQAHDPRWRALHLELPIIRRPSRKRLLSQALHQTVRVRSNGSR